MIGFRRTAHIGMVHLRYAWLALALCGISLSTPRIQAQELTPTVAPEHAVAVEATATCVDGHVVMIWSAWADTVARVTVTYMGLNSGPYDMAAPSAKVGGELHTVFDSVPDSTVTFASQYWSVSHWETLAPQTKGLGAIRCNVPVAVHLSTFSAASGIRFTFLERLGRAFGITH
jgi:hypothetical protein